MRPNPIKLVFHLRTISQLRIAAAVAALRDSALPPIFCYLHNSSITRNIILGLGINHGYIRAGILMEKNKIRFRFFGDLTRLSPQLQKLCADAQNRSKDYDVQVNFCLNYGGRDEIVHAAQNFALEVSRGIRKPEDLTEELFGGRRNT